MAQTEQRMSDEEWQKKLQTQRALDPYLVYADLSGYHSLNSDRGVGYLPFIVETKAGAAALQADVNKGFPQPGAQSLGTAPGVVCNDAVIISSMYKRTLTTKKNSKSSRFITCLVHISCLDYFLNLEQVVRAQIGLPRSAQPVLATQPQEEAIENFWLGKHLGSVYESITSAEELKADAKKYARSEYQDREYQTKVDRDKSIDATVVGVVDDGCAFAHPNMRDAFDITRIERIWRQNDSMNQLPLYVGYGQILTKADIHSRLTKRQGVTSPGQVLRRARAASPDAHGQSVTHIVAGKLDPIASQTSPMALASDPAAQAPIIAVQFGRKFLQDTAGAALGVQALDAVRYIIDRAETYRPVVHDDGEKVDWRVMRKVLITMSYGTMSGPHDGTALLDKALDELIRERSDLDIVVAAGNSHRVACHAQLQLLPKDCQSLELFVSPRNPLLTSVEIWFTDLPEDEILKMQLISPTGEKVSLNGWGHATLNHREKTAQVCARLIHPRKAANGLNGRMALLMIEPTLTKAGGTEAAASSGVWTIQISRINANVQAKTATVEAWAERSDVADTAVRRQQAYFVGDCVTQGDQRRSLASPASVTSVISVGSTDMMLNPGEVSSYSSRDAIRKLPTHLAVASAGKSIHGLRVPGAFSQTQRRASGTSTAAPLHARGLIT